MTKIKITDLRKEFDVPGGTEVAVEDVSFTLEDGEFVSLVGPSGCGKTTTLRCLAGLEIPTSGTISFDGIDVTEMPANERGLAMMFQNIALYPHMSIIDNITYPLKLDGLSKDERYEQGQEAAEMMKIPELVDKYPGELSGGQKQRAALARTIVQDPVAFLMDEPLAALDAKLKVDIRKEIQRVHKELNKPTLYVTHDQEEAMTMSDRIAIMNDGRLEQIGTRDELYNYPKNTFVARFLGSPSINVATAALININESNGVVSLDGVELPFTVDMVETPSEGDVLLGFRPQSVSLSPNSADGQFQGTLSLLEPLEDRAIATVDWAQGELRCIVPTEQSLREDEPVGITIETGNLYLFDVEDERLICKSTPQKQTVSTK